MHPRKSHPSIPAILALIISAGYLAYFSPPQSTNTPLLEVKDVAAPVDVTRRLVSPGAPDTAPPRQKLLDTGEAFFNSLSVVETSVTPPIFATAQSLRPAPIEMERPKSTIPENRMRSLRAVITHQQERVRVMADPMRSYIEGLLKLEIELLQALDSGDELQIETADSRMVSYVASRRPGGATKANCGCCLGE